MISSVSLSYASGAEKMQCRARLCVWLQVQGLPLPCALGDLFWCCRVQEGFSIMLFEAGSACHKS